MMINLSHIQPSKKISKYVRKISLFESDGKIKYRQKLTPSAFTYLSYNHWDMPTSILGGNKIKPKERLQVSGPKTAEDIYVEYNGKLFQILIEFTASGFYYLFHRSPSKIHNSISDLSSIVNADQVRALEKKLLKLNNFKVMVKLLEDFILDKHQNAFNFNDYIEKALTIFEQSHGSKSIRQITEQVGISERQFDRKFREIVGLSPKRYAKLLQLHYAINLMNLKNYGSIQDLAYQAEYYDLAHFTRRFKELTGFSPSEFVKSRKHIALKYFNDLLK